MFINTNLTIEEIAYEKYILRWTQKNIDRELMEETYLRYRDYLITHNEALSFDDYIKIYGYCGECYPTYDDFLENEYKDLKFMETILSSDELEIYQNNLEEKETVESIELEL